MSFLFKDCNENQNLSGFTKIMKSNIIPFIENSFYIIGIIVILYGAISSIYLGLMSFYHSKNLDKSLNITRIQLSETFALGLTFILGAEIVKTFRIPNLYQLIKVSLLVLLRQLIVYFLDKDVKKLKSN